MSETNHTETFKCPNCGAPIEYDNKGEATAKCPYCGAAAMVPPELLARSAPPIVSVQYVSAPAVDYSMSPQTEKIIKTTAVAGGGCILGSILLPIILTVVILGVVYAIISNVFSQVNSVTSSSIPSFQNAAKTAVAQTTSRPRPTTAPPTAAPSPTPGYANVALSFGDKGIGAGKFTDARSIAVDGEGNIYVGEYSGGRIQVFDPQGKFVSQFFPIDKKGVLLGMAVDRKGAVYVSDGAYITRFDGATGKSLSKMSYAAGPGFGELAVTPDGGLVAMWYQRREGIFTSTEGAREDLVQFNAAGKVVHVIQGVVSSQTDELSLDNFPVVDGKGNIYVLGTNAGSIFKYSSDGKFISRIGSAGSAPGEFSSVSSFAIDNTAGNLYVFEHQRASIFGPDGRFIRNFNIEAGVTGAAFNDNDQLAVINNSKVTVYTLGE